MDSFDAGHRGWLFLPDAEGGADCCEQSPTVIVARVLWCDQVTKKPPHHSTEP